MRFRILFVVVAAALNVTAQADELNASDNSTINVSSVGDGPVNLPADDSCAAPGRKVQKDVRGSIDGGARCERAATSSL